jgi:hypothetical protein
MVTLKKEVAHETKYALITMLAKVRIPYIINKYPLIATMTRKMVSKEHEFTCIKHGTLYF